MRLGRQSSAQAAAEFVCQAVNRRQRRHRRQGSKEVGQASDGVWSAQARCNAAPKLTGSAPQKYSFKWSNSIVEYQHIPYSACEDVHRTMNRRSGRQCRVAGSMWSEARRFTGSDWAVSDSTGAKRSAPSSELSSLCNAARKPSTRLWRLVPGRRRTGRNLPRAISLQHGGSRVVIDKNCADDARQTDRQSGDIMLGHYYAPKETDCACIRMARP